MRNVHSNRRQRDDPDDTLGGRTASSFASLLLSLPAATLLWFLCNAQLGFFTTGFIPPAYLLCGVLGFAALAFVFPRLVPGALGKLWALLLWVGKGW